MSSSSGDARSAAAVAASGEPGAPPPAAAAYFGPQVAAAEAYVGLLATTGLTHGLIGPREVPRLWDRHVLNCAVVAELIPEASAVIDVGSGAGLPGIPVAIARPDLDVTLVEPLLRRTRWLEETIAQLGLPNVVVRRGRAESFAGHLAAPVVTARAVSRLANLASWCRPLVAPDGILLALKGASAAEELATDREALRRAGFSAAEVRAVGAGVVDPETTVVVARAGAGRGPSAPGRGRGGHARRLGRQ